MPVRTRLRPHHPSSTVTPALSSHPSSHPSSSSVTSHQTYLVTSHQAPCESRVHSVLVEKGSLPRLSTSRSRDQIRSYFQLPAPHPILISSLCSGPVCGRAWVSRLLPTSGHVAHGPVSSIDETRQPRVSSIARSRLGLPDQTRVTVTHTSAPSPISMRGAAPEVFASGTEREQTGSG